jgi:uncharacterized protein
MKMRLILAVAVAALSSSTLFAQAEKPLPLINVTGSAEVKVAPDEIYLRVGVETRDGNLDTAKRRNDQEISRALAFLKAQGVPAKDVQTDFISIEQNFDDRTSRLTPVYYLARKSIQVRLTKVETFEGTLSGLLTNGVNHVQGIEFRTSALRKHRDTARSMAIKAAKEKAVALASDLGVRCGKVHAINANEWGGWYSGGSYWGGRYGGHMMQNAVQNAGGGESGEETMSLGQISVSASVNVSFLIE